MYEIIKISSSHIDYIVMMTLKKTFSWLKTRMDVSMLLKPFVHMRVSYFRGSKFRQINFAPSKNHLYGRKSLVKS